MSTHIHTPNAPETLPSRMTKTLYYLTVYCFPLLQTLSSATKCQFLCPMHSEANKAKHWSLEQKKFCCGAMEGKWVAHAQKTWNSPNSSKGFQQSMFFKARWGRGMPAYVITLCTILIGWWWDNKVVSQVLTLSILRARRSGATCSWSSSSSFTPLGGGF